MPNSAPVLAALLSFALATNVSPADHDAPRARDLGVARSDDFGGFSYTPPARWATENYPGLRYHVRQSWGRDVCSLGLLTAFANRTELVGDLDYVWADWVLRSNRVTSTPEDRSAPELRSGTVMTRAAATRGRNGPELMELSVLRFAVQSTAVLLIAVDSARLDECRPIRDALIASIVPGPAMLGSSIPAPSGEGIPPLAPGAVRVDAAGLVGTWIKTASFYPRLGEPQLMSVGYTKDQYVFAPDGTYRFASRQFSMGRREILLVHERGRWTLAGDLLEIVPAQSSIEAWSKADNADRLGKLISRSDRALERVTYRVSRIYFSGIGEWNLVLQAAARTVRDGEFGANTTYRNAWYFDVPGPSRVPLEMPPE